MRTTNQLASIIDIVPYKVLPAQMGGQKGIAIFCKYLGEKNQLTIISVKANEKKLAENYELIPLFNDSRWRYANPSWAQKIKKIAIEKNIKNIITEHPYMAWIGWMLKKQLNLKWFVHSHNIEFERFRTLNKWWWKILKLYETWAYKNADGVFFVSPEDVAFAVNHKMVKEQNAFLVDYGIELKEMPDDITQQKEKIYAEHNIPENCKLLFFNGALSYKPNTDALSFILDKINPLLLQQKKFNYRIMICGRDLPASFNNLKSYSDKNVIYAGFVDDITTYFKAADIFLNPVITGGGVKTKAIDAIGFGETVISCKTGAAGINLAACGNKLKLVDDNDSNAFVNEILRAAGHIIPTPKNYYEYYYWGNIINRIQPLFNS
ncbi:MAG TPA: glycosyltransferase [Parafilimonas sp.]|nr:glycosyltransferase [Parafilimonas sp.]